MITAASQPGESIFGMLDKPDPKYDVLGHAEGIIDKGIIESDIAYLRKLQSELFYND